jgi:hypothetical protein
MLLGPANLRRGERRVLFGRGCDDAAVFINDQGARAAGAYVDAEQVDRKPRLQAD